MPFSHGVEWRKNGFLLTFRSFLNAQTSPTLARMGHPTSKAGNGLGLGFDLAMGMLLE
jgi:hypothetical protein